MSYYIVQVKRECRAAWVSRSFETELRSIPGVTVELMSERVMRARIQATTEGLEKLKAAFGEACHIEPRIEHRPFNMAGD